MKTIYKYPLLLIEKQTITVPHGTAFLHAQYQNGSLYIWGLVDTSNPMTQATIEIFGTGHPIPGKFSKHLYGHINTVVEGDLVWHIFHTLY